MISCSMVPSTAPEPDRIGSPLGLENGVQQNVSKRTRRSQREIGPTKASSATPRYAWDRPGFLLWHASLSWQRQVTHVLGPLGLTHAQFLLLASVYYLERTAGAPSQRELSDHAGTDEMVTSTVVRGLESRGLLLRRIDAEDRRMTRVHTTAEGAAVARKALRLVERASEETFAPAGSAGERRIVSVLRGVSARGKDRSARNDAKTLDAVERKRAGRKRSL